MEIQGVITKISTKNPGKYALSIDGAEWYGGFGASPVKKGDEVKITYTQNGQWKNIQDVVLLKAGTSSQGSMDDNAKQRRILDCILSADSDFRAGVIKKEEVFDHAVSLWDMIQTIDLLQRITV